MHHHYQDITSRIAEPPAWFDEHGTPRYGEFTPDCTAGIYSDEVALVEVGCQDCAVTWRVVFASSAMSRVMRSIARNDDDHAQAAAFKGPAIANQIRDGSLHWGDPPNHGHECAAGPTMNCTDLRVLGYWRRGKGRDEPRWVADPALCIDLPDAKDDAPPTPGAP